MARHWTSGWTALPPAGAGQRVGLYGGSFNPAHAAHRLVAETALKRLGLDWVWWLVTPGNPLKDHSELAPTLERMASAKAIARHPRMVVTALERDLGTRYAVDTVAALQARRPDLRFVWLGGADLLSELHRWCDWRGLTARVPLALIDRPGNTFRAVASPAAVALASGRRDEADAASLPGACPPAWTLLHGSRLDLSSTAIRAGRADPGISR